MARWVQLTVQHDGHRLWVNLDQAAMIKEIAGDRGTEIVFPGENSGVHYRETTEQVMKWAKGG